MKGTVGEIIQMGTTKIYSYGHLRTPSIVASLQHYYDNLLSNPQYQDRLKPFDDIVFSKTYRELKNGTRKGFRRIELLEMGRNLELQKIERWCDVEDFNPSSSTQILKYLKWRIKTLSTSSEQSDINRAKLYYIPLTLKTGKETTASKELKELYERTGDPLLESTIEYRSICTNLNNYYPNWEPWEDGCVHTSFQFKPPSGQLNSIKPNVQNLSKHNPIGQRFRRMIEAKPNHYFVEFDKSRFHVVMMGWLANSLRYIRFGTLDCHSIFTSWIINEPSLSINLATDSDETIRAKVKEIRKNETWNHLRDVQSKPTVLGNQLGLGPRKLFFMNRRNIKNIAHAEQLQQTLRAQFPEVEVYKDWIATLASQQEYLMLPFGSIRYFYDVLRNQYDKKHNKWLEVHGQDYEKALAFQVQGNAFGMMKEEWYTMNEGFRAFQTFSFINTIHDSNVFHPPISALEDCIRLVWGVMTSPCTVLTSKTAPDGLTVGTGVSIGRNLQSYYDKRDGKKPFNPDGMREIDVRLNGKGEIEIGGLELVV